MIPCRKTTFRKTVWAGTFSLFLAGCGGGSGSGAPTPRAAILRGQVHGGQSAITSSVVTLYAVVSGDSALKIATTSSGPDGTFDFGSAVTCSSSGLTPATLIYVTANGGNPGGGEGVNNSAINLVAALGQCQNATSVNIDEITTAAAAYALAGFTTVDNGLVDIQASASNGSGIANAFAAAAVLADPVTGATPAALGTAQPQAQLRINSLGNALAACVNTTGPASPQCGELFTCAVPGASFDGSSACSGGSGAAPADTISAALSVARNAGLVPAAGVYETATRNTVFSPALNTAPNDWTIALSFPSGGKFPTGIAIDASGDVWVANYLSSNIAEFNALGVPVPGSPFTAGGVASPYNIAINASDDVWVVNDASPYSISELDSGGAAVAGSPFTGAGLDVPIGIAIDASGNAWIANAVNKSITELDSSGAAVAGSPFTAGGVDFPRGVAIDGSGDVWVGNFNNSVTELDSNGAAVTGSPFKGGGLSSPYGVAIDASDNVWVVNTGTYSLTELDSSGTPVAGSPFTGGGLNYPRHIAIDASGHVWTANSNGNSVTELDSSGAARTPGTGITGLSQPIFIAIDASGDVWITNDGNNTITELVGAAAPTRTPLVATITPGQGFAP